MRKYILHSILLLISGTMFSQVNLEVDTTHIRIGEQIQYILSTENAPKVQFPKLQLDSLGKVEVVHSLPIDTLKKRLYKKYILTSFDSGSYRIPAQEVYINKTQFLTDSLLINVGTVAVDTTKQKLFPIKGIYKAPPKTWHEYIHYLWWLLAALVIIGLVWWFAFRRQKTAKKRNAILLTPIELAFNQFQSLDKKKLPEQQKIKEYYIELSEIVREYIGKDVKIPTLEVTTDELITLLTIHNKSSKIGIDKERIIELHQFLKSADLVKFAKAKPESSTIQEDRKTAETIINNIQAVVHKPVLDEFGNEIIIETEEDVKIKTTKKRRIIGVLIGLAAVLLITMGTVFYYGFNYVKDTITGHPTKELLESNWYHSSYGYPAISLETPKVLKAVEFEMPEQMKQIMSSFSTFGYGSLLEGFFILINTTEYNPQVEFDMDKAVEGAVQMVQGSSDEIKDFKYDVEDKQVNGVDGKVIKATMMVNDVEMTYTQYLFVNENILQQITLTQKTDDHYASKINKRIIKSIQLQNTEKSNNE